MGVDPTDPLKACPRIGQKAMNDPLIGLSNNEKIMGQQEIVGFGHSARIGVFNGDNPHLGQPISDRLKNIIQRGKRKGHYLRSEKIIASHFTVCAPLSLKCDFHSLFPPTLPEEYLDVFLQALGRSS